MKKFHLLLFFIACSIVVSLGIAGRVFAVVRDEVVHLKKGEVVTSDYIVAGENVVIEGIVEGDAYIAGGNIRIDGVINGDLLVAGGEIIVTGSILQDIRATGGNIHVDGSVGRNITVFGGDVLVGENAEIKGNSVIAAGTVSLQGDIAGDAKVGSGDLSILGRIGNNVDVGVGSLAVGSDAHIGGNLTYWSDSEPSIDPNAEIAGTINKQGKATGDSPAKDETNRGIKSAWGFFNIIHYFGVLLFGAVLLYLSPKFSDLAVATLQKEPLKAALIGLLTIILVPLVIIALVLTFIGIPLSILVLILYGLTIYSAKVYVSLSIGRLILKQWKNSNNILALAVGLLVYAILLRIPHIGGLVMFLAVLLGTGAIIHTKKQYILAERKRK